MFRSILYFIFIWLGFVTVILLVPSLSHVYSSFYTLSSIIYIQLYISNYYHHYGYYYYGYIDKHIIQIIYIHIFWLETGISWFHRTHPTFFFVNNCFNLLFHLVLGFIVAVLLVSCFIHVLSHLYISSIIYNIQFCMYIIQLLLLVLLYRYI